MVLPLKFTSLRMLIGIVAICTRLDVVVFGVTICVGFST